MQLPVLTLGGTETTFCSSGVKRSACSLILLSVSVKTAQKGFSEVVISDVSFALQTWLP